MKRFEKRPATLATAALFAFMPALSAQDGPDPHEIPLPAIHTPAQPMPAADKLPASATLPNLLHTADGKPITTKAQWSRRRQEVRRLLEYYAMGQVPPPPGNVHGDVIRSEPVLGGRATYRLVRLSFGPDAQHVLQLHVGLLMPTSPGRHPAIIAQTGTAPLAPELPRSPAGPKEGKGEDVLLVTGDGKPPRNAPPPLTPQQFAQAHADVVERGYALAVYNVNDCAEDTTLREADGSFTFRHTRFLPAYPKYDWGVLAVWAWGASRIADYLETLPEIDPRVMIVTGVSRGGKSAMMAAALDDRLMGAPVVTGGGGIGAYRLAGADGSETLDQMVSKYPNWFGPQLHQFWGKRERLPFDEHWFLALAAPRPFLTLEGDGDVISSPVAVRASVDAARKVYALYGAPPESLGIHYSHHGHAFTAEDWTAMLDFFDHFARGMSWRTPELAESFDAHITPEQRSAAIEAAKVTTPMRPAQAISTAPPDTPAQTNLPVDAPLNPALPTVFIVGDSTARNGRDLGWGDHIGGLFDTSRINVANRARAGRSSRTYINEGWWAKALAEMKPGDTLLLQMGHNDGGDLGGAKPRGTLKGIGDDSQDVPQIAGPNAGHTETVHTFGWYLREMIDQAKAKGVHPVLLTLTVRNIWSPGEDNRPRIERDMGYGEPIRQVAALEHIPLLDIAAVEAARLQALGPEKTAALFPKDHTHSSAEGAELIAHDVADAIRGSHLPLAGYLKQP